MMKTKYLLLATFLLLAAAQLYVPASMILDQEDILVSGKTYKFRTMPVDPNDPMRGKYVILGFQDNTFTIPDSVYFAYKQEVFVVLSEDESGFAKIKNILIDAPMEDVDYIEAQALGSDNFYDSTIVHIEYPFNRFYMEEYKAPKAEEIYFESQRDSTKTTWAVVKVKNGKGALQDVIIDGVSIVDIVNVQQSED